MDKLLRIGQVSGKVAVKPFVLRYWETEFPMLRPVKSARGQRRYRPEDVEVALEIKRLLYEEGFTIAGARRRLQENGARAIPARGGPAIARGMGRDAGEVGPAPREKRRPDAGVSKAARRALREARDELRAILKLLGED
jgi:DNA-binding transcriptional MerR regulator